MTMECRISHGTFNSSMFNIWSCSLCYSYLFPSADFKTWDNLSEPGLRTLSGKTFYPDIKQTETLDPMCSNLGESDCNRWIDCCETAVKCCERQLKNTTYHEETFCPPTWDGWSCFDPTQPGSTVKSYCPRFLKFGNIEGYATKYCTENGTWEKHSKHGREWTDYSNCVNIQSFYGVVYAGVTASLISIILLIPACILFAAFRQLRSQQRIQLHICLFLSFVFTCVLKIMWDLLVYNDRIHNPWQHTFMVKFETGCRTIYILLRYARSTNYYWMTCEGIYLYRLLAKAFNFPKSIKVYFYIGWCLPLLQIAVYSIIRLVYADDTCWIRNAGGYEWVLYTPNFLCIVINFVFLLCILRILLTQLHQHPNEPSNYRRALKATFVLIPLFGLQLFLVIYRPIGQEVQGIYEVISTIIIDSQGGIIALVLCYCNGEVHACLKTAVSKLNTSSKHGYASYATTYSVDHSRGRMESLNKKNHATNYVPMKDIHLKFSNGDV